MQRHEMNGVRLMVEESGRGEPLVLVHGSWDDRQVWAPVRDELARRFRVISYDRRGHAGSEAGREPATRRDDEDDLAALIGTLGPAPAHVVGNSFGASIVLGLAGRRPDLIRTVCAHEPALLSLAADDPAVAQFGEALVPVLTRIERGEAEAAARDFIESVVGPGTWQAMAPHERTRMAAHAHTFAGEQLDPAWAEIDLDAMARIDFPVQLTHGDQSPPFFTAVVARLAEAIDGAEVTTLPGAGHVPETTHPDRYASVVGRFAAGAARGA